MLKIYGLLCLCACALLAEGQLSHIMQNMEYAMNLMEKGFLYNKQEWINEGLEEFKILSGELKRIDANTYLSISQRRDINVVGGIVNRNEEYIGLLERFLKDGDMIKSADVYGRILSGCVSCHAISRGW
ncbi:hypothetical protein LS71_005415 [Helicobacter jaachi]|uniref:Cytochrome C n=1 Tax=Helicobacter jaachi TaxID=1677920 RepID=A0A4U8T9L2_9HELI|nr:hypothetical protein [Helicobacter jaachi]TLD96506.1 hypothetical protein LS71_005415 [Helicobacter jaachi]